MIRLLIFWVVAAPLGAIAQLPTWTAAWPNTDFTTATVPLTELQVGCNEGRDCIPALAQSELRFAPIALAEPLGKREPVILVSLGGESKAYPLRYFLWHEIVMDSLGGQPIAVTYCPLCNSSVVFAAVLDGRPLTFGVSGLLRNNDLVMYDRQTESLWQQFTGECIVGRYAGQALEIIPSRVVPFGQLAGMGAEIHVLQAPEGTGKAYGTNPYVGYDTREAPLFATAPTATAPSDVPPMAYVIAVGQRAWTLALLRKQKRIEADGLVLTWAKGQRSFLDNANPALGRELGTVRVQRQTPEGRVDIPYKRTFAFAFFAFHPEGTLVTK